MRVISVNVGLPRTVQWKGKAVSTAIFKAPVSGRIHSSTLNLDGDRQADLSVVCTENLNPNVVVMEPTEDRL